MTLIDKVQARFPRVVEEIGMQESTSDRWAIIVIGCHCSGKTLLTRGASYPKGVRAVIEVRPEEMDTVEDMIREALNANWRVLVELIFCDDPRLQVERAVKRAVAAEKAGTPFIIHTIKAMSHSFIEVPKAAERLFEILGDLIETVSVDNSKSPEEMKFYVDSKSPPIIAAIIEAQWENSIGEIKNNERR